MKILAAIILMMTFSAYGRTFECQDRNDVLILKLDRHVAKIKGMTLRNTSRMDWKLPRRSYAFISGPWYKLQVPTEMLRGEEGYISLVAHNTQGRMVYSKFVKCFPK